MQKLLTIIAISIILIITTNIFTYNNFNYNNISDNVENKRAIDYFQYINLKKLKILREYWNTNTPLSTDFIRDGLSGWDIELGRANITSLPLILKVKYKPIWADNEFVVRAHKALLLYNNESAVILRKELPNYVCNNIGTMSISTAVLAAQKDGIGYPYVHNSFYYYKNSLGYIIKYSSTNKYYPLLVGKSIKGIILNREPVKILSPYNISKFNIKMYKVNLNEKYELIYYFNNTFYTIKNNSYRFLVSEPLTLYPGLSIKFENLNIRNIVLIIDFSEKNYPLPGMLNILIENGYHNIISLPIFPVNNSIYIPLTGNIKNLILNSTILVNIKSIRIAPLLNINDTVKLVKIYEEKIFLRGENEYRLDVSKFNGDIFLIFVNDFNNYSVKYSSSDFISYYGNLSFWSKVENNIEGWTIIKSNIIYVPNGVNRCGVEIIGYTYNGQPEEGSFVLYQKAYLYPFIVSNGYPNNPYTVSFHSIFYGGITKVDVFSYGGDRLQFNVKFEFGVIRTSIKGSRYYGQFPNINELNISYGYFNWTYGPGCPIEDTDIGIAMLRPDFTRSSETRGLPAGYADALGFISYSASVTSIVLSIFSPTLRYTITTISVIALTSDVASAILRQTRSSAYTDDIVGTTPINSECARYYGSYYLKNYRGLGEKVVGATFSAYYQINVPVNGGIAWGGASVNKYYDSYFYADNDAIFVLLYFFYIP